MYLHQVSYFLFKVYQPGTATDYMLILSAERETVKGLQNLPCISEHALSFSMGPDNLESRKERHSRVLTEARGVRDQQYKTEDRVEHLCIYTGTSLSKLDLLTLHCPSDKTRLSLTYSKVDSSS